MNQGNKAMKILVIFMLSLTLTGGYAQAYPDLYSIGVHRSSTSFTFSISDLLSSDSFLIFGNYFSDFSKPDISSPAKMISKDEAISIAKGLWPGAVWHGMPSARLLGCEWEVKIGGYMGCDNCPEGYWCAGTHAGGTVKINAKTGEIISVDAYL